MSKEKEYMDKLEEIENEFIKLDQYEVELNNKIDEINKCQFITEKRRQILAFKLDSLRIQINDDCKKQGDTSFVL